MSEEPFVHVCEHGTGRIFGAENWPPERLQAVFERYAHKIDFGRNKDGPKKEIGDQPGNLVAENCARQSA
ncbi:MAG: hypothetical protein IKY37_07780 [Bacteroidaceae bacterium]|nr:hypothetical protein [Bacteroidaceae bacterium]